MASQRRIGAENSKTRAQLIEAAELLMQEEGYVAISARRIAERAGLKPQLVHYYFRAMDDLFMAVFRHFAGRFQQRQQQALSAPRPIEALWALYNDSSIAAIVIEFLALANHRPTVRDAIIRATEEFRAWQIAGLTRAMKAAGLDAVTYPPSAIIMLMSTISTTLVMETNLGVTAGHAELHALATGYVEKVEASRRAD